MKRKKKAKKNRIFDKGIVLAVIGGLLGAVVLWAIGYALVKQKADQLSKPAGLDILRQAAEGGSAKAQIILGNMYYLGTSPNTVKQDANQGRYWYQKAVNQGDAEGQANLGYMDSMQAGVNRELMHLAFELIQKSAKQGFAKGEYLLGMKYASGDLVKKDLKQALQWCERAAYQEYPDAQNALGNMYESGSGVKKDLVKAYLWYGLTAGKSNISGLQGVTRLERVMTPEQIKRAKRLFFEWKPQHFIASEKK